MLLLTCGTAFLIGESGLTDAIHDVGYVITDHDPEFDDEMRSFIARSRNQGKNDTSPLQFPLQCYKHHLRVIEEGWVSG